MKNYPKHFWQFFVSIKVRYFLSRVPPINWIQRELQRSEAKRMTSPLTTAPFFGTDIIEERLKVTVISPWYQSYPVLVTSLLEQNYKNWELLLVHDGPVLDLSPNVTELLSDPRIHLLNTEIRANDWGHSPREFAFEKCRSGKYNGDFIVVSNSDNYHVPGFLRLMLEAFSSSAISVYCDMIHNDYYWRYFNTKLTYSFVDCGCLMTKFKEACEVGWQNKEYEADWHYITSLIDKFGISSFVKLPAPLLVHN